MKHIIISFVSLLFVLNSCNSIPTVTRATGAAYEVVVVMDKEIWDGAIGTAVKEELTAYIPYLPEAEAAMRYTYSRPDQFDSFLKFIRNILIVNINKNQYTKVSLLKSSDNWAHGQSVLYLNAPDADMVEAYLAENKGVLVNHFTKEEMRRAGEILGKHYSMMVMEKVQAKFGININVPQEIGRAHV